MQANQLVPMVVYDVSESMAWYEYVVDELNNCNY